MSHKGFHLSPATKEKLRIINLGKHHSEATKEKCRLINLGKKASPETREKLKHFGKDNPMYGKHHTEEAKRKIGLAKIGHKYNLGRKHTPEQTEKIRQKLLGKKPYNLGKTLSVEQRKKMSKSHLGKTFITDEGRNKLKMANLGKHLSNETKEKMKRHRATQTFPKTDTKIETKIQNFLRELGLEFYTHQFIKDIEHDYQCDILIPALNLVIECDGDYWHKYPIGRDIDRIRTGELIEKGFKVLRLWECEIKIMEVSDFENKLKTEQRKELP